MEEVILEAQLRKEKGKSGVSALRHKGFIPAVIYGASKDSQSLKLSHNDFLRFIHQHPLESTLLKLKIKGHKSHTVLIKDVQYHPVKDSVIHIDFQEISLTSEIKVNVGIVVKGEAIGVKQEGGILNHILWELEVECLPTQIPEQITVDVSQMKLNDVIHVRDLSLPEGIKALNDPDSLVLSVEPPKVEEVAVPAAEGEEPSEPEVIKEKKEVSEEGGKEEKEK